MPSWARLLGDEVITVEEVGQVEPLGFTSMITSLETENKMCAYFYAHAKNKK